MGETTRSPRGILPGRASKGILHRLIHGRKEDGNADSRLRFQRGTGGVRGHPRPLDAGAELTLDAWSRQKELVDRRVQHLYIVWCEPRTGRKGVTGMSILGRWLSPSENDRSEPWPGKRHVSTEPLRDWWAVDCWFHKKRELAEAHYEGFLKWTSEHAPDSIPYLSWAPYTKLRVDISCLKCAPIPELEKQFRDSRNRFYLVAFCYARNEYADIEQYQAAWRQSGDYESFGKTVADPKSVWPREGVKVTPEWYHAMILKTAGSQWIGYHGFEERRNVTT